MSKPSKAALAMAESIRLDRESPGSRPMATTEDISKMLESVLGPSRRNKANDSVKLLTGQSEALSGTNQAE